MSRRDSNDATDNVKLPTSNVQVAVAIGQLNEKVRLANVAIEDLRSGLKMHRDEIAKLNKTLQSHSFDPIRRYGKNEKIDYRDWASEEECLTETSRIPTIAIDGTW